MKMEKPKNDIQLEINLEDGFKEEQVKIAKENNVHENLLNKVNGKWLACGMPIEDFKKERTEIVEKLDSEGYKIGEPNLLSKINGIWHILYHRKQVTTEKWKSKIDLERLYDDRNRTPAQKLSDQIFHRKN